MYAFERNDMMKSKSILTNISTIILIITLIIGVLPIGFASAQSDSQAVFTDLKMTLNENYEGAAFWVIELTADKEIGFGDNSYWYRNLQQYSSDEERSELVESVRKNIIINGKSIDEGLNASDDNVTSTRVKVGCSTDKTLNKLWIAVTAEFAGQKDNVYGVNDYTDFTLEFRDGLILNSYRIKPVKYKYRSYDQIFKLDTGKSEFAEVAFECDNDYEDDQYYVIMLKSESEIGFGDGSFPYRNLQLIDDGAEDSYNSLANSLRSSIIINGITVGQALESAQDHNFSTRIKIGCKDNGTENNLYIAIKRNDNPYGITADSDFIFEIRDGITLNGFNIESGQYRYCAASKRIIKNNGFSEFIEAKFAEDSNYEGDIYYVITLKSEAEIGFGNNSYWDRNLQQINSAAGDEHNALAKELRSKILINGKDIESALNQAEDKATSTRIKIGCKSNNNTENYLYIAIKKSDNQYGVSLSSDFTLEFKEGIILNDKKIPAAVWNYNASNGKMTLKGAVDSAFDDSGADDLNGATIQSVSLTKQDTGYCSSHGSAYADKAQWIIRITTDKIIGTDTSYYGRHLQVSSNPELKAAICTNILINGKTLNECLEGAADAHTAIHIKASDKVLEIAIPVDNNYGFNGDSDFMVKIQKEITLNGYLINPRIITYTAQADGEKFTIEKFKPDPPKTTANVISALLEKSESGFCSNHPAITQWVIKLKFDADISPNQDPNYYDRHLQVTNNAELQIAICNNILLNEKSVGECLAEAGGDAHAALHVKASGSSLEIAVPTDNVFGFDGENDFTITVSEGITLNTKSLTPVIVNYVASADSFEIKEKTDEPKQGNITEVKLTNENDKIWVITLTADEDITVSGGISSDLQFADRQRTEERKKLSYEIIEKITINGETLAESMERAENHYTARVSASGNNLVMKLNMKSPTTVDNDFHISDKEDFTVCIREALTISGVSIAPVRYRYDSASGSFVIDDGEDIKCIAEAKLYITGSEIGENGKGISLWPGGGSRYVRFLLDGKVTGNSHNAEALATKHGEQCRQYIFVDGMSVSEWIGYGEGDVYQVMIRFKDNYIEFLFDGSREPGMVEDEAHWIEIKDGLYSATGEKIMPQKLYYNPDTGFWELVDSFDGLEKPWIISDFEKRTENMLNGIVNDPSYILSWYDGDEKAVSEMLLNYEKALEEVLSGDEAAANTDTSKNDESENSGKKVIVKKYKKVVPSETVYEYYLPVWSIALIAVGAATLLIIFIVKRRHRKTAK